MPHRLTLQRIAPVTHDTYHLVFPKPEGFTFTAGQATEMRLMKEGWRDEGRPFTFTSLPEDDTLDFVIKSYPDHDGVTEQVAQLEPGDTVEIGDVWGAIADRGPGTFIAGGAGITPFIPILRQRAKDGALDGSQLIFSNGTRRDIILRDEWDAMDGLTTTYVLTDEGADADRHGRIDRKMLEGLLDDRALSRTFYICGPQPMEEDLTQTLRSMGVPEASIVTEDH